MVKRIEGDFFDKWHLHPDELREAMIAAYERDKRVLFDRGYYILPTSNDEYILDKSHQKLMALIADNMGIEFDLDALQKHFGFRSMNNTKTLVKGCIKRGYITHDGDRLNMTFDGMTLLEAAETEGADWELLK